MATNPATPLATATHTQNTYNSTKTTTHWIRDLFSPVFQAVDCLEAAFADMSASIMATFPSTPDTQEPPKQTKVNQNPKQ